MSANLRLALAACALVVAVPAHAEDRKVPYWASIRAEAVNMHVGPGEDYKTVWVYRRQQLPLKVLRLKDGWRLVEDPDGAKGWVLARFLTLTRGVIVSGEGPADMREKPDAASKLLWRLSPGVSGKLGECPPGWCRIDIDGRAGFVAKDRLWGAGEP